jgi:hypothetical protein
MENGDGKERWRQAAVRSRSSREQANEQASKHSIGIRRLADRRWTMVNSTTTRHRTDAGLRDEDSMC